MKKVILINQNAGYLTIDIANAFAQQYEKVILIAGIVKPMDRQLNSNVRIQRIIKYNRTSNLNRIITWAYATVQTFMLLLFKYSHYEVVYFTNPPMAYLSSIFLKNNFSVIIYDIYPDALVNIGINEKNFLFRKWMSWNKKLFKKAKNIFTLSSGMAQQLSNYVNLDKIIVIPNWSGSEKISPIDKNQNPFILEHNLINKFVVMYSGNMGYTHNLETIIGVAKKLVKEENIRFLFIGEGSKKEKLVQLSIQNDLQNCIFLTWQPINVFPYSIAAADVSIVTLNEKTTHSSVPSKVYNLLAVGSPLICITSKTSELSSLVEKYNNGKCFEKENINEIASFITTLSDNNIIRKKFSENSLMAAKDFSYSNALKYLAS